MNKKFLNGLVTQYLYQIVLMSLQFVVAPLLLKFNGTEALGGYASISQFIGYLTLLDLGFSTTLSRYLAQSINKEDQFYAFKNYFSIGRWYLCIVSVVIGLVIASLSFYLPQSLGLIGANLHDAKYAMLILAFWYGIRFYFTMFGIALFSSQNMKASNIAMTIGILIRFILTIAFIYKDWGITGIVLANVIGDFVTSLLQKIIFDRKYPSMDLSWHIYDKTSFKELFSFGLDTFLINISTRIILSSTTFVSGIVLGAAIASHYYSMVTPIILVFTFINMIMYNMIPKLNEMKANGEMDLFKETYLNLFKTKTTLLFAAFFGILLFHKYFIEIWVGKMQYEGFYFTFILALYLIVITISSFNENVLIVLGDIKWFAKFQIFGTIMGLLFTISGGYIWGLKGIVLGNLVALAPISIIVFVHLLQKINLIFVVKDFFPSITFSMLILIASSLIFLLQKSLGGMNMLYFILTIILFIIIICFFGISRKVRTRVFKIFRI